MASWLNFRPVLGRLGGDFERVAASFHFKDFEAYLGAVLYLVAVFQGSNIVCVCDLVLFWLRSIFLSRVDY